MIQSRDMRKLAGLALLGFLGPACLSTTPGAISQVIVVNNNDNFTVTLVGFGYSGTVDRPWACSTPQANVTLGTSMLGGSVHIVIRDNANTVVYDNTHSGSMGAIDVQTMPGAVAGAWRVTMDFSGCTWAGAIVIDADTLPKPDAISIGSGISTSDSNLYLAGWDASVTPVHVSVATGLNSGSIRVRIWNPTAPPGTPSYDITVTSASPAVSDDVAGAAGTWTVQIDFNGASLGGAISITN